MLSSCIPTNHLYFFHTPAGKWRNESSARHCLSIWTAAGLTGWVNIYLPTDNKHATCLHVPLCSPFIVNCLPLFFILSAVLMSVPASLIVGREADLRLLASLFNYTHQHMHTHTHTHTHITLHHTTHIHTTHHTHTHSPHTHTNIYIYIYIYIYNLRSLKFTLKHLKRSYMFRSHDHPQGENIIPC